MLLRPALAALLTLATVVASSQTKAQTADDLIDQGRAAESAEQWGDAARAYRRAIDVDNESAEAHYRLARTLLVVDQEENATRALRLVQRASRLDPTNVAYLSAELEALRGRSWNLFMELARLRRRLDLAQRLLAIDSTNAVAHEELAIASIRDYYQYRNAISLPGIAFASSVYDPFDTSAEELATDLEQSDDPDGAFVDESGTTPTDLDAAVVATATVGDTPTSGNRLSAGRLRELGGVSFEKRADRAYADAVGHLRTSLASDVRRRSLYDEVMRLAALSGEWNEALSSLRSMFVHFPEDPEMWLYLGVANHRAGEPDAAAVAFDNALERMDEEARATFEDLSLVLPPDEVDRYRRDPEAYAAAYWSSRDPRFLTPANERRIEHYTRLATADLLYRSSDLDLPGWETDRGKTYVRYGEPDDDFVIEGDFNAFVEAYRERIPSLAENATLQSANRLNVWDYGDFQFVFEDINRTGEFSFYTPPADLFGLPSARRVQEMDYVLQAREIAREVPQRYDYRRRGQRVDIPARVTAFRGDGGRADVLVHYGVPLADGVDGSQEIATTLSTGAFLVPENGGPASERRRTIYGLRGEQVVPFDAVNLWVTTETLPVSAGATYTATVEFETGDLGAHGVNRQDIEIPDFDDGLQLSDLLLAYSATEGEEPGPGRVARGGVTVRPAPWGVYRTEDPVVVYFEVYGLQVEAGRTSYEIEARLVPKNTRRGIARIIGGIFGGGRRGVSTGFPVDGVSADDGQYVLLDASGQEPGVYTLRLTLRDTQARQSVDREVDILLE